MSQFWKPSTDNTRYIDRDSDAQSLLVHKRGNKRLTLTQQKESLPIFSYRSSILYALENFSTLILVGETGSGKSTQLPIYLHEAGWTNNHLAVVCTQPRKIAAITVASRVAEECGCAVGELVGFGVRFNFKCSSQTRIKYYTDGVLLRETLSDPLLSKYSVIIIDEAHMRSLHSDILLGLLKKIQRKRVDLRIVVMSATLDAAPLKSFFETNFSDDPKKDTTIIMSVEGRVHPVDLIYLQKPVKSYIRACVDTVIDLHRLEGAGDVLVFLPGSEDIDVVVEMLEQQMEGKSIYFVPLYSTLPPNLQMNAFAPAPSNMRKVVVATNIAETSVTIEGIRFVIDSGFVKLNYFDVRSGLDSLITSPISKSSALQRAGRAGRTCPGKCFRLMTEACFDRDLAQFTTPEMQRADISWSILQLKALGIDDVLHFDFLSPPHPDALVYALELLHSLNAIDKDGVLTHKGRCMAELPAEPRLSCVLLNSLTFGCSEDILSIIAMCSVEYPFITVRGKSTSEAKVKLQADIESFAVQGSDHLTLLGIFSSFKESGYSSSWCASMSLSYAILNRAKEIRVQLLKILMLYTKESEGIVIASCGGDSNCIKRCLVSGYFAHAAKLGNDGVYRTVRGGVAVQPHPQSVLSLFGAPPEWVIFNTIFLSKAAEIREVSEIEPMWLLELAEHYYQSKL